MLNTDYGKGGKGLGKGGAKSHRKVLRDNIQGITKPAIRRLARRGGVKRISGLIYEETRGVLKVFLENVIRDAVTYTEHARRKTVSAMDVVYALKWQGRTLYGFGGPTVPPGKPEKKKKKRGAFDEGNYDDDAIAASQQGPYIEEVVSRGNKKKAEASKSSKSARKKNENKGRKKRNKKGSFTLVSIIGTGSGKRAKRVSDAKEVAAQRAASEAHYRAAGAAPERRAPKLGESEWYRRIFNGLEREQLPPVSAANSGITRIRFEDAFPACRTMTYPKMLAYRLPDGNLVSEPCMIVYQHTTTVQCDAGQCQWEKAWEKNFSLILELNEAKLDLANVTTSGRRLVQFIATLSNLNSYDPTRNIHIYHHHYYYIEEMIRNFMLWLHNEHYTIGINSVVQESQESQNYLPARAGMTFAVGTAPRSLDGNYVRSNNTFAHYFTEELNRELRLDKGIQGLIPSPTKLCRAETDTGTMSEDELQSVIDALQAQLPDVDLTPKTPIRDALSNREHGTTWADNVRGNLQLFARKDEEFASKRAKFTRRDMCRIIVAASKIYQYRNEDQLDYEVMSFDPNETWQSDAGVADSSDEEASLVDRFSSGDDAHGTGNLLHRLVIAVQLFFGVVDSYCMNKGIYRKDNTDGHRPVTTPMGAGQKLSNLDANGQYKRAVDEHGTVLDTYGPNQQLIHALAHMVATRLRKRRTIENELLKFLNTKLGYPLFLKTQKVEMSNIYRELQRQTSCALYSTHPAYDHLDEMVLNLPTSPERCLSVWIDQESCAIPASIMICVMRYLSSEDHAEELHTDIRRMCRIIKNISFAHEEIDFSIVENIIIGTDVLKQRSLTDHAAGQDAAIAKHLAVESARFRQSKISNVFTPLQIGAWHGRKYQCGRVRQPST